MRPRFRLPLLKQAGLAMFHSVPRPTLKPEVANPNVTSSPLDILWYIPRAVDGKLLRLSASRLSHYLGGHSLQVFAWSIFVSYVAFTFKDLWVSLSPAWRMLLALTAALSLALPAWVHEQWRFMVQQRAAHLPGINVFMPRTSSASAEK